MLPSLRKLRPEARARFDGAFDAMALKGESAVDPFSRGGSSMCTTFRRCFDSEMRVTPSFALGAILPKKNNHVKTTLSHSNFLPGTAL